MGSNLDHDPEDLALAAGALNLSEAWLKAFTLADPFNGESEVKGFLCRKPDHRYGALVISHVDGQRADQVIAATPKLHYPFDKTGTYRFPAVKKVTIYDKLDGTNVLGFTYLDAQGSARLSYKLRLSPFLRNGKHGAFLDLWREALEQRPALNDLVRVNQCHVSFEMYGSRNAHLIQYEEKLNVVPLFGVRPDWSVVPLYQMDLCGIPGPVHLAEISSGEDLVEQYNALRVRIESENQSTDDGKISGTEGAIWYAEDHNSVVTMWKCKPETVEAIHWATGINKDAVLATCRNVLESDNVLDFSTLKPLLLEEYSEDDIEDFRGYIDECIDQINKEMLFVEEVLAAYRETGLLIEDDKRGVMRALSAKFSQVQMKKVYSLIMIHGARR